ncbi:MAG TPA: ribonuclease P protein component [Anaerolineales bacterium]
MQRKFRLTRSDDFKRVRRNGKSYAHPLVVLIAQASEQPRLRVGVAAGQTVGNAVHRNRAKRLLREAIRPLLPALPSGWELVLIARPGMLQASLEDTRLALNSLLLRAGLIPQNDA